MRLVTALSSCFSIIFTHVFATICHYKPRYTECGFFKFLNRGKGTSITLCDFQVKAPSGDYDVKKDFDGGGVSMGYDGCVANCKARPSGFYLPFVYNVEHLLLVFIYITRNSQVFCHVRENIGLMVHGIYSEHGSVNCLLICIGPVRMITDL